MSIRIRSSRRIGLLGALLAVAPWATLPARALTYTFENASFSTPQGVITGSFDYTLSTGITDFSSVNVSAWYEGTQAQQASYDPDNQLLEFSRQGSNQGDLQYFRISGLQLDSATQSLAGLDAELERCRLINCQGSQPRTETYDVTFSQQAQLTAVPAVSPGAALVPLGLLLVRGRRRYLRNGAEPGLRAPAPPQ